MSRNAEVDSEMDSPVAPEDLENLRDTYLAHEAMSEAAEEEERILDMVLENGIAADDSKQGPNAISSLPRTSDSSGFSTRSSGRTWESSVTAATNATTLSTLAEGPEVSQARAPSHDTARTLRESASEHEAGISKQKL